jgi:hypothetical protein
MKNCLLIPVHPVKANWLLSFLNSIRSDYNAEKRNFCIVLATTNHSEYRLFNRLRALMPINLDIRIICIDDYIRDGLKATDVQDYFRKNEKNGLVNIKIFVGLHWCLSNGCDLVGSMDSDVIMLTSVDKLFEVIAENYDKKLYFGATTGDKTLNDITGDAASFLEGESFDELRNTEKVLPYCWFFDLPSYRCKDLAAFFDDMSDYFGGLDRFFLKVGWLSFEHLIFQFWRHVKRNAQIINVIEAGISNIPERMTFHDVLRIQERYGYSTAWFSWREIFHHPDILYSIRNLSMAYHFDRF